VRFEPDCFAPATSAACILTVLSFLLCGLQLHSAGVAHNNLSADSVLLV
jgi:hypothetical protein